MGMETACARMDGDKDRFGWRHLGTDSKFMGMERIGINVHPHAALYHVVWLK